MDLRHNNITQNTPDLFQNPPVRLIRVICLFLFVLTAPLLPAAQDSAKKPEKIKTITRTRAEVNALIREKGRTPPEWWDSVPLEYPKTLDMTWKKPPRGSKWNPRKNIGNYVFSVIYENPGKWKQGAKFLHHVLAINKNNPAVVQKAIGKLANVYHDLLEDWARAAFWYRKSRNRDIHTQVRQARCYWKLGNKDMAAEILSQITYDYTRYGAVIKLWADMGELDKAIEAAEKRAKTGRPKSAYLAAGDACRLAGKYKMALSYYKKVLAAANGRQFPNIIEVIERRARDNIKAMKLLDMLDLNKIPDGVYKGDNMSFVGQLYVEVTVKNHRIESVEVVKHKDKQYFTALTDTPKQLVEKQSIKGVDAVTGATITSEAIINATAKALASGMK